jgi:hypothetical protein
VDSERDYYKDELLNLLTAPMERVAHMFQEAFLKRNYHNELVNSDWARSMIAIEFTVKQPTSDEIRDIVFSMYQKKWGGKPAGIEVAYNRAIDYQGRNQWVYSNRGVHQPIRLFITSDPKTLGNLINGRERAFVLDDFEFSDWRASWAHNALKRASLAKPKETSPALINIGACTPEREIDPGEQVPVVRMGLFKL